MLVFWACGVTPQLALRDAGADLVATHEPGCMLITDVPAASAETHLSGLPHAATGVALPSPGTGRRPPGRPSTP